MDPRNFLSKASSAAAKISSVASATNSSLSKVASANAKLSKLASVTGSVSQGLQKLVQSSNNIRNGTLKLPMPKSDLVGGLNMVLNATGISIPGLSSLPSSLGGVVKNFKSLAQGVFGEVADGVFTTSRAKQVAPEFLRMKQMIEGPQGLKTSQSSSSSSSDPSPYANDLIPRAPKFKFLFILQFVPMAGYSGFSTGEFNPLDAAFVVSKASRPTVKFEQEDVNFYGYRTKALKKMSFGEASFTLLDDNTNSTLNLYDAYTKSMSPIMNRTDSSAHIDLLELDGANFTELTGNGQAFGGTSTNLYAATTGTLANDHKTIFSEIRIYHIFDYGKSMSVTRYHNPQITQFDLDDLDMASSEACTLQVKFTYDTVHTTPDIGISDSSLISQITSLQRGARYVLMGGNFNPGSSPIPTYGDFSIGGGSLTLNRALDLDNFGGQINNTMLNNELGIDNPLSALAGFAGSLSGLSKQISGVSNVARQLSSFVDNPMQAVGSAISGSLKDMLW